MDPAMITGDAALMYELIVRALIVGMLLSLMGLAALIWKD